MPTIYWADDMSNVKPYCDNFRLDKKKSIRPRLIILDMTYQPRL